MPNSSAGGLVIVGGSLAGTRAALAARHVGYGGTIRVLAEEDHPPYDRPPLSKQFLSAGAPGTPTALVESGQLRDLAIDYEAGKSATGLDTSRQVVVLGNDEIPYTALVIATGSHARPLPHLSDLDGVHSLRTLDDARAIRSALDDGARTVIIGGGFIGAEVASAARKRGLPTSIVEASPAPLERAIGPEMGRRLSELHAEHGTALLCQTTVTRLLGHTRVTGVELSDGRHLEADLVIVGVGSLPSTGWLEGSGVRVDDGVLCDSYLRTTAANVFAAGDVARWYNPTFGRHMRVEHWTGAAEQGAYAARNALQPAVARPYSTVPYFWSDLYDARIQFVGVIGEGPKDVVFGDLGDDRFVALFGEGDKLCGALALNGQRHIMKYRRLIAEGSTYKAAFEFSRTLAQQRLVS